MLCLCAAAFRAEAWPWYFSACREPMDTLPSCALNYSCRDWKAPMGWQVSYTGPSWTLTHRFSLVKLRITLILFRWTVWPHLWKLQYIQNWLQPNLAVDTLFFVFVFFSKTACLYSCHKSLLSPCYVQVCATAHGCTGQQLSPPQTGNPLSTCFRDH